MNRKDYLEGRVSHEDYYRSVYQRAGLTLTDSDFLDRVRRALEAGDEHLNTIPLHEWDLKALRVQQSISRSLEGHDDYWSSAGGVCVLKQLAEDRAREA